ncbi:unnamed protein product, partial [Prorocentrum cordatum]
MTLLQPLIALLAQAVGVSSTSSAASASLWTTAQGAEKKMTKGADVQFKDDFDFDGPVVGISGRRGQSITGFGSAFTEAAASVFAELPTAKQEQLLQLLFGKDGMGFTVGRVHINSCDFSIENYDFDGEEGDVDLKKFDNNVTHDQKLLIPLITRAQEVLKSTGRNLSLLASPWSPPWWMKTSGQMDGSDDVCLKDGMRPTWAKYISKWISAYQKQGVPIWAITVQNEPEFNAPWEACKWSKEEEAEFVGRDLGPTLRKDHPDVKIFAYDHNKDDAFEWAEALLGDSTASRFLTGIGLHWYSGDMFDQVAKIHEKFPDAVILGTEATFEKQAWDAGDTMMKEGKWSFGEGYAHDIMGDLKAGATGWIDWNLALDKDGGPNHVDNVCDAAIIVSDQSYYVHPQLYYMGHFSKWVLPGSEYIETYVLNSVSYSGETRGYGTCKSSDGLQAASFMRPDEQVALVVLNCGDTQIEFKIHAGEKAAKAKIPAHAIQTYLISRSDDAATPEAKEDPPARQEAEPLPDDFPPAPAGARVTTRTGTTTTTTSRGAAAGAADGAGPAPGDCTYFNSGDG